MLFLLSKQNLNPPLGTFDTLTIIENELKMKKLCAPPPKK
jgi:hypothetical protein